MFFDEIKPIGTGNTSEMVSQTGKANPAQYAITSVAIRGEDRDSSGFSWQPLFVGAIAAVAVYYFVLKK